MGADKKVSSFLLVIRWTFGKLRLTLLVKEGFGGWVLIFNQNINVYNEFRCIQLVRKYQVISLAGLYDQINYN